MPGIFEVYTDFADSHVRLCGKKGNLQSVSRANVELQVLNAVDKADIPFAHKMSWYHTVLASSHFDGYWASISAASNLPEACTARYAPDQSLFSFEEPSEDAVEADSEDDVEEGADDDAGDEADDEVDEEADEEIEDDVPVDTNAEPHHEVPVEVHVNTEDVASVSDRKSRPLSPDSSSDLSYDSDEDPKDHPLFLVRVERPSVRCRRCNKHGHTEAHCLYKFPDSKDYDWSTYESEDSEGEIEAHQAKVRGKVLFVGLERRPEETRDEFERRSTAALDNPCRAWKEMNPRASEEANNDAYEDAPYKCGCRRRVRGARPAEISPQDGHEAGEDSAAALSDSGDEAQGEEDDGEYGASSSKSKGKGKAKALPTVKSAAKKPQGVTKKKPTQQQPRKERTPAQIRLLEAATTTPQSSRDAESRVARIEGTASLPQTQGQGIKRSLEDESSDEEPLAKRAKVGGAADGDGGHKMAPLKKGQGKKGGVE